MIHGRDIGDHEPPPGGHAEPIPLAADGLRDDAHAVIIGIDRYADARVRPLRYARADAEALYCVLTDPNVGRFRPGNVTLLADEAATCKAIRKELSVRLRQRVGCDHTVVVYFAGHGAPHPGGETRNADGLDKYLVPHDAELDALPATAVPMDDVERFFRAIPARQLVFFLDCCYSGAGGRSLHPPGFQGRSIQTPDFINRLAGEGRLVITACSVNEVSLESPDKGHGLFTFHLLRGLGGAAADADGLVAADALYKYVFGHVEHDARQLGGTMNPVCVGSTRGAVHLTRPESPAARRARQLRADALEAALRGDHEQGVRCWEEISHLTPGDPAARDGLMGAYAAADQAKRARAAARRARQAELDEHGRTLLSMLHEDRLTASVYGRALDVLHKEPDTLTDGERAELRLLKRLLARELTASQYVRSVSLHHSAQDHPATRSAATSPPPTPPPAVATAAGGATAVDSRPAATYEPPAGPAPAVAGAPAAADGPALDVGLKVVFAAAAAVGAILLTVLAAAILIEPIFGGFGVVLWFPLLIASWLRMYRGLCRAYVPPDGKPGNS